MQRAAAGEYDPFFAAYVARVPDGDVLAHLTAQARRTQALVAGVTAAQADHAYAAGKWTVKRLIQHLCDSERMFGYRALCIARGDQQALPGFDEVRYAENDGSGNRPMATIAAEFAAVRAATVAFFAGLDDTAWSRRGTANGAPVTVRALLTLIAGHELHHLAVLRERYGIG